MKKILFAIAIVLTISFTANAQSKNDSFVAEWGSGISNRDISWIAPTLPSGLLGIDDDVTATTPLGSGLLVLTALGAGYAVARKRKK